MAVLVGLAAGWQWCGLRTIVGAVLAPLTSTAVMLGAVACLAAAVGPWLPERVVLGVVRRVSRRPLRGMSGNGAASVLAVLPVIRRRDESLMWLALAVLALVAGLVSMATLLLTRVFALVYDYLMAHFFWTDLALTALEWLGVALLVGVLWLVHGLLVAALWPITARRQETSSHASGLVPGLLLGFGAAWLSYHAWADRGLSGGQGFLLGVAPTFVLAGVAAGLSQRADRRGRPVPETPAAAPELPAGAEGLIWLALVVLAAASVLTGWGWLACRSLAEPAWPPDRGSLGYYLLVLGVGGALAALTRRERRGSASGCGMAVWVAGVAAGAGATLFAAGLSGPVATAGQLLLLAVPVGYALHYAERAWLARVASEALGFAQLISALLAGVGVGLIAAGWWALPRLGALGLVTAGALAMLACGGLIQIYEQDRPLRIKQGRLGLVFASLAGAMVLFPADARRWVSRYGAASSLLRADALVDLRLDDEEALPDRVWLIGDDVSAARPGLEVGRVKVSPLAGQLACALPLPSPVIVNAAPLRVPAFRAARLDRRRWDLIYQRSATRRTAGRFAEYSVEWLTQLAEHIAPGGRIVLDVPVEPMTPQGLAVIVATFQHAVGVPAQWRVVGGQDSVTLRLTAAEGAPGSPMDDGRWSSADRLLGDGPEPPLHSLQRDRLTPALREPGMSASDWLAERAELETAGSQP